MFFFCSYMSYFYLMESPYGEWALLVFSFYMLVSRCWAMQLHKDFVSWCCFLSLAFSPFTLSSDTGQRVTVSLVLMKTIADVSSFAVHHSLVFHCCPVLMTADTVPFAFPFCWALLLKNTVVPLFLTMLLICKYEIQMTLLPFRKSCLYQNLYFDIDCSLYTKNYFSYF